MGEALTEAVEMDVEGSPVRVFTAEHLAAIALQTGRAKDKARLLQFVESGILIGDRFREIPLRHGLGDAWSRFAQNFLSDKQSTTTSVKSPKARTLTGVS